jgi:hypothetical protein
MESLAAEIYGASPEREARFFYGLFLRGHSIDNLRQDIDVSTAVVSHWKVMLNREPSYREALDVMLPFRKKVLEIFDGLIDSSQAG